MCEAVKLQRKGELSAVGKVSVEEIEKIDEAVKTASVVNKTGVLDKAETVIEGFVKKYSPVNPHPELMKAIQDSFSGGTFTEKILSQDTVFYRVYGGKSREVGSYLSRTPQGGGLQSQLDLALNPSWGNTTENITKVVVPQGTVIYEGAAASQYIYDKLGNVIGELPGGGSQIYTPRVEVEWFK